MMGSRWLPFVCLVTGCGEVVRETPIDAAVDAVEVDAPIDAPPSAITNGNFEQDYAGWMVSRESADPTAGVWGIAASGTTFQQGDVVRDFANDIELAPGCFFQTPSVLTLDGGKAAYNAQNNSARHLMQQDVAIPQGATRLTWEMSYFTNGFDLTNQFLAIELRDPANEMVLATVFVTDPAGNPPTIQSIDRFEADISAHAGRTVRLTVHLQVQLDCFFAVFDNFRVF
jgi:hypothetical protein